MFDVVEFAHQILDMEAELRELRRTNAHLIKMNEMLSAAQDNALEHSQEMIGNLFLLAVKQGSDELEMIANVVDNCGMKG